MAVKIQPFFNIQHDWNDVLSSSSDKVWISCSKKGWPSVYGEVITKGNGKEKDLVVTNGFEIKNFDKTSITVSYPKWNCSTKFVASSNTFKNIHLKSVRGLDISPGGSLGVSSGDDKSLNLWQSSDGTVRRVLEGHVTDVTSCQFFPSGVVVLTGGSDMQLKIWSAEDGSCPVTLKGHRGGISDTAIIEKGRNVVSCSRDGSARLWDCGTATCLGVITECSSAINACAAATVNDSIGDLGVRDEPTNEKEVGSDGKLLLLAREDKILQGVGLHSRQKLFELSGSSAFNACCFMSERMAVAGTQDGCLHKYDLRYTSKPLSIVKMSGSSILSMTKFNETCLVSTGDGSCFLWTDEDAADVCLTGPDCDSVYKVRANGFDNYYPAIFEVENLQIQNDLFFHGPCEFN